ncbi:MAG: hypothetical protein DRJ64_10490 [Thermoprotei archaeon]|nr:MAG: hypothetical protein DRJ64_10490 [Thermoprotei archaeon]
MAFIEVDDMDFHEVLEEEFNKGQVVILKFGSEYCDGCIALDFELEELDDKHENISVLEIDPAESEALAQTYNVTQVPTMVIYEDADTILWQKAGIMLAADIEKLIDS